MLKEQGNYLLLRKGHVEAARQFPSYHSDFTIL